MLATSWLGVSIASFDDSTRPRSIALKGGATFPAWFNGVNSNKLLPHTRAAVFSGLQNRLAAAQIRSFSLRLHCSIGLPIILLGISGQSNRFQRTRTIQPYRDATEVLKQYPPVIPNLFGRVPSVNPVPHIAKAI